MSARRRTRRWLLLAPLLAGGFSACGGPAGPGAKLDFALAMSEVVSSQTAGFQVAVLAHGDSYDCQQIQSTCLRTNPKVASSDLVPLTGSDGQSHSALFFPNALQSAPDGQSAQQEVAVTLAPGKGYLVVVEAISDGTPTVVGNACYFLPNLESGDDNLLAVIRPLSPSPSCDPRFP